MFAPARFEFDETPPPTGRERPKSVRNQMQIALRHLTPDKCLRIEVPGLEAGRLREAVASVAWRMKIRVTIRTDGVNAVRVWMHADYRTRGLTTNESRSPAPCGGP
jgi:hypothetical protein